MPHARYSLTFGLLLLAAPLGAEPLPVRLVAALPDAAQRDALFTGTIEPLDDFASAFRDSGRLIAVPVREGDRVAEGQELARIDPTQADAALRAAQAALTGAEAALRQAQQARDRAEGLLSRGAGTRADLDAATEALLAATAGRDQAAAALTKARSNQRDTVLRAPQAGTVTARSGEPGQVVEAGQAVVQIAADTGLEAVFNAPDAVDLEAFLGHPVTLSFIDRPEVTLPAAISEVAPLVDAATGSVKVKARVDGMLPEGMAFGSAVVGKIGLPLPGGMSLPWTALTTQGGKPAVWVVDPASMTVTLTPVVVADYGAAVVRLSGGLEPGALVVTEGSQLLYPGRAVIKVEDAQ